MRQGQKSVNVDETNSYDDRVNPTEKGGSSDHQQLLNNRDKPHEQTNFAKEWIGLMLILLVSLGNQWQRYVISYANGIGKKQNDPKFEIATNYSEQWDDFYGILTGIAFTFSFAVFGIFGGVTADIVNRKMLIIICSIGWTACTFFSGWIDSFWVFLILRIVTGIFQAFMNPAAYSIIADYFPPEKRTFANSVFNTSIYLGGALASLSTIVITSQGWRFTYIIISIICAGITVLGVFLIYNPTRGRWNVKKKEEDLNSIASSGPKKSTLQKFLAALTEIFQNPTCRWVSIGGFFRFFGGFTIAFFMPRFFKLIWFNDQSQQSKDLQTTYAISNAFVVSVFGFMSTMIGGVIGDKFEQKGILMTKAYITIFSGIFGSIFFALCSLVQIPTKGGFAFAISMLALEYLTAENWIAPAITMLINTISAENKSFAVSAFLFFCTLGGTLASAIAQPLFNSFDVDKHPERAGHIMCVMVLFSYLGSIPWFYLSGLSYSAFKRREQQEQEQANQGF